MSLPLPTSVGKSGGKKSSRKGRKGGRKGRRALKSRLGKVASDLQSMGLFVGAVGGSAAVASAAKGYLGEKMDIMGKVDGRLALGAAGAALKLSGKAGAWDGVVTNVTTGILTSWLSEKGFEFGARRAAAAAPAIPAAAADGSSGVVIGNIYGGTEVGLFGSNPEKRLEKKLAKLKAKAEKKGIEWSDVANEGEDDEGPRGGAVRVVRRGPVVVRPAPIARPRVVRPWFRVAPRRRILAR